MIKGIAILLVVFGHCIQFGIGAGYYSEECYFDNVVFKLIYSFHMPLFMLVSGYFFGYSFNKAVISRKGNWITASTAIGIAWSKLRQLLVPILSWALVPFSLVILKAVLAGEMSMFIIVDYIKAAIFNFWFLWAILINAMVILLISMLKKGQVIAYIVVLGLTIFSVDKLNFHLYKFMFPYFVIGFMWHQRVEFRAKILTVVKRFKWYCLGINGVIYAILFSSYHKGSYIYTTGISVFGNNGMAQIPIDLHRWIIGFVGSFLVMFLVYVVIEICYQQGKFANMIAEIGKSSLVIYILSGFINSYVLLRITDGLAIDNIFIFYAIALFEGIVITAVCMLLGKIISNFRWSRIFLLGGR